MNEAPSVNGIAYVVVAGVNAEIRGIYLDPTSAEEAVAAINDLLSAEDYKFFGSNARVECYPLNPSISVVTYLEAWKPS
jgi:hypothetical protein